MFDSKLILCKPLRPRAWLARVIRSRPGKGWAPEPCKPAPPDQPRPDGDHEDAGGVPFAPNLPTGPRLAMSFAMSCSVPSLHLRFPWGRPGTSSSPATSRRQARASSTEALSAARCGSRLREPDRRPLRRSRGAALSEMSVASAHREPHHAARRRCERGEFTRHQARPGVQGRGGPSRPSVTPPSPSWPASTRPAPPNPATRRRKTTRPGATTASGWGCLRRTCGGARSGAAQPLRVVRRGFGTGLGTDCDRTMERCRTGRRGGGITDAGPHSVLLLAELPLTSGR